MTRVCLLLILFFLPGGLCAAESPEWLRRAGIIKPAAKSKEPKIFSGCFCLKRCILRSIEWYQSRPRRPKFPSDLYSKREKDSCYNLHREFQKYLDEWDKKFRQEEKLRNKEIEKLRKEIKKRRKKFKKWMKEIKERRGKF